MTISKLGLPLPIALPIGADGVIQAIPGDSILEQLHFLYAEATSGMYKHTDLKNALLDPVLCHMILSFIFL